MKKTVKGLISTSLMLVSVNANALILDFIDNSDILIGSIRFSNTELDGNNEWSITPALLTGGSNVYAEPGVVDIYVTLYDTDGNPTYTGSSWSDASATETIFGLLGSDAGNHAQGGTISVPDSYYMYPYDIDGNPVFDNLKATITPLNFQFSDVTGADRLVISDLSIDSPGNFVVQGAAIPGPTTDLLLDFGLISVITAKAKREKE